MDRDVENAYAVETPFRCQVQKLVSCIFELLLNSWFSEAGRGEEVHQNFEAHTTERAEGFNFSGVVERWTIDELRKALRKAHVDGQEDEMLSRLGESTPFVFGLIAASNIDELLPLYRSLQEHLRSGFDEIMYDAASAGEGQSSSASSMMDLSDEDDTSMLDEDEDQTAPHRDSGCESDHDMDCDSCEIGERPEIPAGQQCNGVAFGPGMMD
ncbi:hypothetical protein AC578_9563 [Pseudocercospora eumusae]|uniref:Uncharacterized protein n=1 Tax=Pseudocercospora eumusae TaxID=321146 RepID=A0A139HG53_9PEZI|nr:hypothetical protein AC578_9563 [Pseudocercospora eumusae]